MGVVEMGLVLVIPIVAILGGIFLAALKILKGESRHGGASDHPDETRLIQDIHHGLQKMEDRIDALETIMLDAERSRKRNG